MKRFYLKLLMWLLIALALIFFGLAKILNYKPSMLAIGFLFLIGYLIVNAIIGHCPHCRRYSKVISIGFSEYCPYCGQRLE